MSDLRRISVLVVDDEPAIREQMSLFLAARGFEVHGAPDGASAFEVLASHRCRVALVDYVLPGMDGLELTTALRERYPELVVLMMTGHATVESAVVAIKAGAHDYLPKPVRPEQLEHKLRFVAQKIRAEDELVGLRELMREANRFDELVGASAVMRRVFALLGSAARSDLPVLITGETGTGKELAARAIHSQGPRVDGPFVALNCAAVPEGLIESELFGHVRGAFTGAVTGRAGKLASAHGGTLLLDELSAAPLAFQSRLLRVLEERAFSPVGSDASRSIDVRVVAAMNTPPHEAVARGQLRQDLLYRLNALHVVMPPLRERGEDLPLLVEHFLKLAERQGRRRRPVPSALVHQMMSWSWPGNIRQLQNALAAAMAVGEGPIGLEDIPPSLRGDAAPAPAPADAASGELGTLKGHLAGCERRYLERVLEHTSGNMRRAAALLEIDERSLRRKLAQHGIDRGRFSAKED